MGSGKTKTMKPVKIKMALIFHPLDPTVTKLLQFRFEALRLRQGKKPKGCKFASVGLVNLTVSNGRTTPERGTPTAQEELAEQVQDYINYITIPPQKKNSTLCCRSGQNHHLSIQNRSWVELSVICSLPFLKQSHAPAALARGPCCLPCCPSAGREWHCGGSRQPRCTSGRFCCRNYTTDLLSRVLFPIIRTCWNKGK